MPSKGTLAVGIGRGGEVTVGTAGNVGDGTGTGMFGTGMLGTWMGRDVAVPEPSGDGWGAGEECFVEKRAASADSPSLPC
jgi:hypothetical protein